MLMLFRNHTKEQRDTRLSTVCQNVSITTTTMAPAFMSLQGKTALITGGGSGICLDLTKKLLDRGSNVVIADLKLTAEAEDVVAEWKEGRVVFVKTDVTDWKQLQAAFDLAVSKFGGLEIVVPGAGVFEPDWTNFWEFNTGADTNDTSSYKVFDINLTHPVRATQLAIDYFLRQKLDKGCVCLIASIAAQLTVLPVPLYCASKHAVAAFTRSLAQLEPLKGIRVNAVAPGIVETPLWPKDRLDWIDKEKDKWVTKHQVTEVMLDLITNPDNVGGTVLEVLAEKVRRVEVFNDPGPQGPGSTLEKMDMGFEDVPNRIEKNFGK
ncbi:hypothetical protein AC578_7209 [Pseudocercospora eumusae]|uniref:Uncharacterized protein n=1 Tax=Pseudocercospora eumusae TaxID=321146 RepID=A0A139HX22_9PEZI|nr:hypothetical protein AC578_7209 [Pseudocercospora eumusae]